MNSSLLVLGYVWPEPNSSAAGAHMLSLIKSFKAQGYQVTFASPAQLGEHRFDLQSLGVDEVPIAINDDSFDDFLLQLNPDVVLFDRFMLEEQFGWRVSKHCPQAIKILDTEDLHSLRLARHTALKQRRAVELADLSADTAKREIAAILRCDLSLIISDYEFNLLQNTYSVPAHVLYHCPFILPAADEQANNPSGGISKDCAEPAPREHFISIGNFRHGPNWDAVLWLKQQVWPLIRQQLPTAELHIYGAYPPPKATQLHQPKQGFLVKGWAADATQVMQQAKVCLAPLRFGAGIKGKLALALQCGTPTITTDLGVEGMTMGSEWPTPTVTIDYQADMQPQAQQIAEHAVALYNDQQSWLKAQQKGYALLAKNFNQAHIQQGLHQKIAHISKQLQQHRLRNFTGQMLQHHSLKSTQYMSQWIAEKNRHRPE